MRRLSRYKLLGSQACFQQIQRSPSHTDTTNDIQRHYSDGPCISSHPILHIQQNSRLLSLHAV